MGIRLARASILLVGKVKNTLRIQRAALCCIAIRSSTWALVGALVNNQSLKL